jgi:hypothetical protein
MKLAIYGDSFGYAMPNSGGEKFLWCKLLAEKLNAKVYNFSADGSGIYGGYQEFLKSHKEFDLCIFLVTHPNRYFQKVEIAGVKRFVNGLNQIEFIRKSVKLTSREKQQLEWLEGWYMCSEPNYNRTMADFILDDIQRKKPNTIIYPCFDDSLNPTFTTETILPLMGLLIHQLTALKKPSEDVTILWHENYDKLAAHFTEPYNVFVADLMFNKIKNGKYDYSGLSDIKLDLSIDYYDNP